MRNLDKVAEFIEKTGPSGARKAFGFYGLDLKLYLQWAESFGYLIVDSSENDVCGVAVVYPVAIPFNSTQEWFFSFSKIVPSSEEHTKDLCVMDLLATTPRSRNSVITLLKRRFWNWENQQKWALRNGIPRQIKNKTIYYLEKHGLN